MFVAHVYFMSKTRLGVTDSRAPSRCMNKATCYCVVVAAAAAAAGDAAGKDDLD